VEVVQKHQVMWVAVDVGFVLASLVLSQNNMHVVRHIPGHPAPLGDHE